MPYTSINELPDGVKDNLPEHAQDIYKEAFNSAYEQYDKGKSSERHGDADPEETAHKVAWSAVKKAGYQKGENGKWHKI